MTIAQLAAAAVAIGFVLLLWRAFARTDNPPRSSPHRYDQDGGGITDGGD